jgi:hypothetical protein
MLARRLTVFRWLACHLRSLVVNWMDTVGYDLEAQSGFASSDSERSQMAVLDSEQTGRNTSGKDLANMKPLITRLVG